MARYRPRGRPVSMNPLSNRACRFPAHGLTMIFLMWRACVPASDTIRPFTGPSLRLFLPSPNPAGAARTWHTPIAGRKSRRAFFPGGCWPFPACPHAYLLADVTKAGSLPSGALSCAPSLVVWTPRTPSWLRATSAIRPYMPGLCPTRLPGRASPVTRCSVPTCHRLRPRGGPAFLPA